jgi:glutamyl-tRNA synthetase
MALEGAGQALSKAEFNHDSLDAALRGAAADMKMKAGQMFQPIRVAVCGRKEAPPLFETLAVLGRETTLKRIDDALKMLRNGQ